MHLDEYVDGLRDQFLAAADAQGPEASKIAATLAVPLQSAIRLALLDALSAAAAEITGDLAPGSVDLRLRSGEPEFVVSQPESASPTADRPTAPTATPTTDASTDDGAMTRINLRLSETLKSRVEDVATADKLSVNAWIVRAIDTVIAGAGQPVTPAPPGRHKYVGQHVTGWVR